jgi:hypothetical protein
MERKVKLFMQECNYCQVLCHKDELSLKKWVDGQYCCSECISKDILKHESLICVYDNIIKMITNKLINHQYEIKHLCQKKKTILESELNKSIQNKTVLSQKLILMKLLKKSGRLKYKIPSLNCSVK